MRDAATPKPSSRSVSAMGAKGSAKKTPRSAAKKMTPSTSSGDPPSVHAMQSAVKESKKQYEELSKRYRTLQAEASSLRALQGKLKLVERESEHLKINMRLRDDDIRTLRDELESVSSQTGHLVDQCTTQVHKIESYANETEELNQKVEEQEDIIQQWKQTLQEERISHEMLVSTLREQLNRTKPSVRDAVSQCEPFVDERLEWYKTRCEDYELQVKGLSSEIAFKMAAIHQNEESEKKLKNFCQHLQKQCLEKTQQIEELVMSTKEAQRISVAKTAETAQVRGDLEKLKYLSERRDLQMKTLEEQNKEHALILLKLTEKEDEVKLVSSDRERLEGIIARIKRVLSQDASSSELSASQLAQLQSLVNLE